MKDKYNSLAKPATAGIIVKKSRFMAVASPVENEEEALLFIGKINKEHSQANHNVFAYVINERIQRFSDDGEPGGTAGKPVLDVIRHKGLSKVVIVVSRYFGGILLGAGGLVRAYSEAAVKGIEAAGVVERLLYQELCIIMDYQWLGVVKREVENAGGQKVSIEFGQSVQMKAYLRPTAVDDLTKKLNDITAAQVIIQTGNFVYL